MSCLFSIVFIWFLSSAVGNQSGVDTWHRAKIVACLLMNKIPPSYCSSLQAFMLNFGLCNLLVERWYRSRDGTRRLMVVPYCLLNHLKDNEDPLLCMVKLSLIWWYIILSFFLVLLYVDIVK